MRIYPFRISNRNIIEVHRLIFILVLHGVVQRYIETVLNWTSQALRLRLEMLLHPVETGVNLSTLRWVIWLDVCFNLDLLQ